jgi:hypothetical protein
MRACKRFIRALMVFGLVGLVSAGCTVVGNTSHSSGNTNVPLQRGANVPAEAVCC